MEEKGLIGLADRAKEKACALSGGQMRLLEIGDRLRDVPVAVVGVAPLGPRVAVVRPPRGAAATNQRCRIRRRL